MIELGSGVGLTAGPLATSNVTVPPANEVPLTDPVNIMELAVNEVRPKLPEASDPELSVTLLTVLLKPLN